MTTHDPFGAALAMDPDVTHNGKISAQEAFLYADVVHNAFDTPVYSSRGDHAYDHSLNQKWRWIFLYTPIIVAELKAVRERLALKEPEYRAFVSRVIVPKLTGAGRLRRGAPEPRPGRGRHPGDDPHGAHLVPAGAQHHP